MTKEARKALDDCKGALDDFKEGIQGSQWRRHFILCITLLRTVGHVLNKVDSSSDAILKKIIDSEYEKLKKSKPKPEIYWVFIDQERNLILKEYKINAGQSVTININKGKAEYSYPYYEKSFSNLDQRTLIKKAIDWWEEYLANIEKQYKNITTQSI